MSGTEKRYWDRVAHLSIENYGGTLEGLDIKFNIEKIGDVYAKFSCGILGLSRESINKLTVFNPADAVRACRKIEVHAGYRDGTKNHLLCKGYIFNAMPTPPPEMWLNMDCLISAGEKIPVDPAFTMSNKPAIEVFRKICSLCGKKSRWECTTLKEETNISFTFEGTCDQLAEKFASKFGVVVYEDNGTFVCVNKNGQNNTSPANAERLDSSSGLIAVGGVTVAGATVRTRLNDSYRLFSWVDLQTRLVPKANGLYYVLKKRHVGHLRGDEWYTELTLIRGNR